MGRLYLRGAHRNSHISTYADASTNKKDKTPETNGRNGGNKKDISPITNRSEEPDRKKTKGRASSKVGKMMEKEKNKYEQRKKKTRNTGRKISSLKKQLASGKKLVGAGNVATKAERCKLHRERKDLSQENGRVGKRKNKQDPDGETQKDKEKHLLIDNQAKNRHIQCEENEFEKTIN